MPQPYLDITAADGQKQVPIADQPITIGRHISNVIQLSDQRASRYHCVIERKGDALSVRDLDSSNGTKVNGRVIKQQRVGDGDVVQIGGTQIKVVAPSLAPAPRLRSASAMAGSSSSSEFAGADDVDVVEVEIEDEPEEPA